jgi:putative nucleotidyltransferase with HDIG domain
MIEPIELYGTNAFEYHQERLRERSVGDTSGDVEQARHREEFLLRMPYHRAIEEYIDPYLQIWHDPELYFGESTGDIMYHHYLEDPITVGHEESVALAAVMIARETGLDLPEHEVAAAGLLHDIWKKKLRAELKNPDLSELHACGSIVWESPQRRVWVPDESVRIAMLNEADVVFTPDQRERVHVHPTRGAQVLRAMHFPRTVVEGAEYHHACFVYPLDAIPYPVVPYRNVPEMGKLINFADHIVTARSARPYKPVVPEDILDRRLARVVAMGRTEQSYVDAYHRIRERMGEPWMVRTINVPCVVNRPVTE